MREKPGIKDREEKIMCKRSNMNEQKKFRIIQFIRVLLSIFFLPLSSSLLLLLLLLGAIFATMNERWKLLTLDVTCDKRKNKSKR